MEKNRPVWVLVISGFIISVFAVTGILITRHLMYNSPDTLNEAESHFEKKRLNKALKSVESIRNKDNPRYLLLKGKIWYGFARRYYDTTGWRDYGTNSDDWFDCSACDSAVQYLKAASENEGSAGVEAKLVLSSIYIEKGWFSSAESILISLLREDRDNIKARINLAVVYSRTDRHKLAQSELRKTWRMDPGNPEVVKNMAVLYRYYIRDPDSAAVWMNRYLNIGVERDPEIYVIQRELRDILKRYPELKSELDTGWMEKKNITGRKPFMGMGPKGSR